MENPDGDPLAVQQRVDGVYARTRKLKIGFLPITEIKYFETVGEVRREVRAAGGEAKLELRDPGIAEQLEILANLTEWGYLTREEFETEKRLLAQL